MDLWRSLIGSDRTERVSAAESSRSIDLYKRPIAPQDVMPPVSSMSALLGPQPLPGTTTLEETIPNALYPVPARASSDLPSLDIISKQMFLTRDTEIASNGAISHPGTNSVRKPSALTVPVPHGKTKGIRPESTIELYQLCTKLGLARPEFDFRMLSNRKFVASVTIGEGENMISVDDSGAHDRKGDAKNAVSDRALDVVKSMHEGGLLKKPAGEIEMSDSLHSANVGDKRPAPAQEWYNWVGILDQYCQATAVGVSHHAQVNHFQLGEQAFSCIIKLPNHPGQTFGDEHKPFANKKAAKAAAAADAVEWLRRAGHMDEDGPPRKKSRPPSLASQNSSRAPSLNGAAPLLKARKPTDDLEIDESEIDALKAKLGVIGYRYNLEQIDGSAVYSGGIYLHSKKTLIPNGGPVGGGVDRVFGRENAKARCRKQLLDFLREQVTMLPIK